MLDTERMFALATLDKGGAGVAVAGGYTQIPQKFYHPNASRHALGLVGGNDVSVASGNLVDIESDLRGTTRDLSNVPSRKFQKTLGPTDVAPLPIVYMERSTG